MSSVNRSHIITKLHLILRTVKDILLAMAILTLKVRRATRCKNSCCAIVMPRFKNTLQKTKI